MSDSASSKGQHVSVETVYLVKFEGIGYYAEKQPKYSWSFTDDPLLANRYKTTKAAHHRGKYGVSLGKRLAEKPEQKKYTVEAYSVKVIMEPIEKETNK